jgi:hypothetical protein
LLDDAQLNAAYCQHCTFYMLQVLVVLQSDWWACKAYHTVARLVEKLAVAVTALKGAACKLLLQLLPSGP